MLRGDTSFCGGLVLFPLVWWPLKCSSEDEKLWEVHMLEMSAFSTTHSTTVRLTVPT